MKRGKKDAKGKGKRQKQREKTKTQLDILSTDTEGEHFHIDNCTVILLKPKHQADATERASEREEELSLTFTKCETSDQSLFFNYAIVALPGEFEREEDRTPLQDVVLLNHKSSLKLKDGSEDDVSSENDDSIEKERVRRGEEGKELFFGSGLRYEDLSDELLYLGLGVMPESIDRENFDLRNAKYVGHSPYHILKKKFSYVNKKCQARCYQVKNTECQTQPKKIINYNEQASKSSIYEDFRTARENENRSKKLLEQGYKERNRRGTIKEVEGLNLSVSIFDLVTGRNQEVVNIEKMDPLDELSTMIERTLLQNINRRKYEDLAFWDDESDKFRDGQGSLLPIFSYSHETGPSSETLEVVSISVNKFEPHLIAVAMGSFNYSRNLGIGKYKKPLKGLIRIYSLKAPGVCDRELASNSGVIVIKFNDTSESSASLLVVGCFDGFVRVYDVSKDTNAPIFEEDAHLDPVRDLYWLKDAENFADDQSFYSIGEDGFIFLWTWIDNSFTSEKVMTIKLKLDLLDANFDLEKDAPHGTKNELYGKARPTCFEFSPSNEYIFLVGTGQGKIYKCSRAFSDQYLHVYKAHFLDVYCIRFNKHNPRYFASCSSDWKARIWDDRERIMVTQIELFTQVTNVAWSAYSSEVLVISDLRGNVIISRIKDRMKKRICEQKVILDGGINCLHLDAKRPLVFIADNKGTLQVFKLSPNLRT
eukprot:snap_masked-scaffold_6-processed-gene-19.22-mRNA-1 protein AED:0.46 eAED:0.46 QI:0/0/0/0.33/1/1/3/0/706